MASRKLHIVLKMESDTSSHDSLTAKILPLLLRYDQIIISVQGIKRGKLLEIIRPLTTENFWKTLIVYNCVGGNVENCDEIVVTV